MHVIEAPFNAKKFTLPFVCLCQTIPKQSYTIFSLVCHTLPKNKITRNILWHEVSTVVPGFRVLGFSVLPGFRALKAGDGAWSVHKTLFGFSAHCKLFARSGNMQNLCHTLSLFHACSLNNYCLLQPKLVCFIILELMPVVVTCMYLFYCFLGFVHITCTCLFEKHVFNRGKCDTGFPVPLTCQPVYKMG